MEKEEKNLIAIAEANGYTLDYLTCGSPIFQVKNHYTFTSDSILIAHSVLEKEINTLVDLCSGSGVVGLEVVGTKRVHHAYLVELQEELAKAAEFSSRLNKNKTEINVINHDVKTLEQVLNKGVADVVTCNPPYFKAGSGDVPENISRALARHEITLNLEDIIKQANYLLNQNGSLYLIHIYSRLSEIEKLLKKYQFKILSTEKLNGKLERVIVVAKKV